MSSGSYLNSAFAISALQAKREPRAVSELERILKTKLAGVESVSVWNAARWKRLNWNFLAGMLAALLVSGVSWGLLIYLVDKVVR